MTRHEAIEILYKAHFTSYEIADLLQISYQTVRPHWRIIENTQKLAKADRFSLVPGSDLRNLQNYLETLN